MSRVMLSLVAPPLAVCRYGSASCCAAPIGVFWIAGITGLIYGGLGGPLRSGSVAWSIVALGLLLWMAATAWALLAIQRVNDERERLKECNNTPLTCPKSPLRPADPDESDPLEELRKINRTD